MLPTVVRTRTLGLLAGVVVSVAAGMAAQPGAPDRGQSRYWTMPNEVMIPSLTVVRRETITLSQPGTLLVASDGHVRPASWPSCAAAWMWITVDGVPLSNTSTVDWWGAIAPQPHSISCRGVTTLSAGQHTIELVVDARGGSIRLAQMTNLSVYVNPARYVAQQRLAADTPPIVTQFPVKPGSSRCVWGNIPFVSVLDLEMPTEDLPAIFFGSGRTFVTASAGDSMVGFFQDQVNEANEGQLQFKGSWSVQDLFPSAELHAAVFCQGVFTGTPPSAEFRPRVTLGASEFPPSNHPNQLLGFKVGADATLVGLAGGLTVTGSAGTASGFNCQPFCVGGTGSGCGPLSSLTLVSRAVIDIPAGHDGIVFFSAAVRCQGDPGDEASNITLFLQVDGQSKSSIGRQGIGGWLGGWDAAQSQRTLGASFLATGADALAPGQHVVEVYARAFATTVPARVQRMSIWDDDPFLVWF